MRRDADYERKVITEILASEKLEGIQLEWIKNKLAKLIQGIPPDEVFSRHQAYNQKIKTVVTTAELARRINELRLEGYRVLRAKELASDEFGVSFSKADQAWKKHGRFFRKELPRESIR